MKGTDEGSHASTGLAVLMAAAAVALAACGASSSLHVASLATRNGDGSAGMATNGSRDTSRATAHTGDPTRLLDQWAACMRSHGDTGQADPTIDAHGVINIVWNPAIPGGYNGTNKGGQGNSGPGQFCRTYLDAAQTALRGGHQQKPPDQATMEKFSECMRANGIHDFPDPTPNGLVMSIHPGTDLDPRNPTFQNASKLCAKKYSVPAIGAGPPPPGTIELNGSGPGG